MLASDGKYLRAIKQLTNYAILTKFNCSLQFFIFLLVVVVSEIAAGAWAFHNKDKLSDVIRQTVKHTVQEEYSVYPTRTVAFDGVQKMVRF